MNSFAKYLLLSAIALLSYGTAIAQPGDDTQRAVSSNVAPTVISTPGSKAAAHGREPIYFSDPSLQVKQVEAEGKGKNKNDKTIVFTSPELEVKRIKRN